MFRSISFLFAGVVALTMAGAAKADNDLMRLDGKGDADVTETRGGGGYHGGYHGGGGFYRGGGGFYRGGYGYGGRGYYGGYGRGYYGYGRGYGYGGYYRPYWGFGLGYGLGYGGYYGGYYGSGYYGNSYYGGGYYAPSYYYSSPCTCSAAPLVGTTILSSARPALPQNAGDGTFPYDGGPRDGFLAPLPTPVKNLNRPLQPRDGLQVSIPAASSGYRFVAFGEQPVEPTTRSVVATNPAASTLQISYPAFGEPMPTFSAGTMNYNVALR